MMVLMSKMRVIVCLFLVIFVGVQFEYGESEGGGAPFIPTKVTVDITNRLEKRYLALRCKDKHHDLGLQQLNVGQTFSFRFYPNYFINATLYFCHFVWSGGDHHFDIYVEERDEYGHHNRCSWDIFATGPCKYNPGPQQCFKWTSPAARKRLLLKKSNNTLFM
ncbi:hypothetical protein PHAVU_004G003200 [Phaseolus vulgaris]|uniref:S-protein homolog n=1 Tax=Phaseolus vulgaris TaxID=3885 RepID=V7C0I5_PHAVU|nr:hypothetical protein PHAVU_004G003200g [Phaseolus vulgaris]ESW22888.1 hypothetical protein PHAVU_004G003200g [Phaseolus vulgaris]